jgi:selenophosphate synthetase-related protein
VLPSVELLSEGQQLKIVNAASDIHRGGYVCTATNKVGTADLGFDVDVICTPCHRLTVPCAIVSDFSKTVGFAVDQGHNRSDQGRFG